MSDEEFHQWEIEAQQMYEDPDFINWLIALELQKDEGYYEAVANYFQGGQRDIR